MIFMKQYKSAKTENKRHIMLQLYPAFEVDRGEQGEWNIVPELPAHVREPLLLAIICIGLMGLLLAVLLNRI